MTFISALRSVLWVPFYYAHTHFSGEPGNLELLLSYWLCFSLMAVSLGFLESNLVALLVGQ